MVLGSLVFLQTIIWCLSYLEWWDFVVFSWPLFTRVNQWAKVEEEEEEDEAEEEEEKEEKREEREDEKEEE